MLNYACISFPDQRYQVRFWFCPATGTQGCYISVKDCVGENTTEERVLVKTDIADTTATADVCAGCLHIAHQLTPGVQGHETPPADNSEQHGDKNP